MDEYNNQNMNGQNSGLNNSSDANQQHEPNFTMNGGNNMNENMNNSQNNVNGNGYSQNQSGMNQNTSADTTYSRNYKTNPDPNMVTRVNPTNGGYQGQNMNQGTQSNQGTSNNQGAPNNQGGSFYGHYDPRGGASNGQFYQNQNPGNGGYNNYNPNQNRNQRPVKEKVKKEHKVLKFIGKAALFGLIAGGLMVGCLATYNHFNKNDNAVANNTTTSSSESSSSSAKLTTSTTTLGEGTTDVSGIVDSCMPSIVAITSTFNASNSSYNSFYNWFYGGSGSQSSEEAACGSGVIISETDDEYMIVTNNHVISDDTYGDATKVQVTFCDDNTVEATVKGTDSDADLAVLIVKKSDMKSDTINAVKIAVIGDSDSMKVGNQVVAIGNAVGYGQSVTTGVVSALNREIQLEDKTMTLLQTDAAINPGNSGGALLNMNGELIGINSAKLASDEVEGMGYAIPMATAQPIIEELMNEETVSEDEAAYLGIYGSDVSSEFASAYDMPEGVWVSEVSENSPAEEAGIQQRDIITKFNDRTVSTMSGLQEMISKKKAGTEVTITVERQNSNGEYKEVELKVTLGKKSEAASNGNSSNSSDNDSNSSNGSDNSDGSNGNNGFNDNGNGDNGSSDNSGSDSMNPFDYFYNFNN